MTHANKVNVVGERYGFYYNLHRSYVKEANIYEIYTDFRAMLNQVQVFYQ